jgi:hypothetical protein
MRWYLCYVVSYRAVEVTATLTEREGASGHMAYHD